jgi:hypothetical protein
MYLLDSVYKYHHFQHFTATSNVDSNSAVIVNITIATTTTINVTTRPDNICTPNYLSGLNNHYCHIMLHHHDYEAVPIFITRVIILIAIIIRLTITMTPYTNCSITKSPQLTN